MFRLNLAPRLFPTGPEPAILSRWRAKSRGGSRHPIPPQNPPSKLLLPPRRAARRPEPVPRAPHRSPTSPTAKASRCRDRGEIRTCSRTSAGCTRDRARRGETRGARSMGARASTFAISAAIRPKTIGSVRRLRGRGPRPPARRRRAGAGAGPSRRYCSPTRGTTSPTLPRGG